MTISGELFCNRKTNFYDAVYSPVILFLNAVAVAAVMLLAASGNAKVLALFGMSVGTSVAVINYISQVFSPIENLGMEIQTIQSAVAGVYRINEFLAKTERENMKRPCRTMPENRSRERKRTETDTGDKRKERRTQREKRAWITGIERRTLCRI